MEKAECSSFPETKPLSQCPCSTISLADCPSLSSRSPFLFLSLEWLFPAIIYLWITSLPLLTSSVLSTLCNQFPTLNSLCLKHLKCFLFFWLDFGRCTWLLISLLNILLDCQQCGDWKTSLCIRICKFLVYKYV